MRAMVFTRRNVNFIGQRFATMRAACCSGRKLFFARRADSDKLFSALGALQFVFDESCSAIGTTFSTAGRADHAVTTHLQVAMWARRQFKEESLAVGTTRVAAEHVAAACGAG